MDLATAQHFVQRILETRELTNQSKSQMKQRNGKSPLQDITPIKDHSANLFNLSPYIDRDKHTDLDTTSPHSSKCALTNPPPLQDSTGPWESDRNPHDRLCYIAALEAQLHKSAVTLYMHRALIDVHMANAEFEDGHLQHLTAMLEEALYCSQHKGQGGNYARKDSFHDQSSGGTNPGQQPNDTHVPDFMEEYVSERPDAGPPPADDRPHVKRCSVGRPTGIRLQPGTREYQLGRCDKHLSKAVFADNMKAQVDGEDGYKFHQHAWKCSGIATKKPLCRLEDTKSCTRGK